MSVEDFTDTKWAVMVCLDGKDDWIFVTEDNGSCDMWNLQPVLFEDINEAMSYANTFSLPGREENVMVVNYEEEISKR
jgi:hypothetical protein